jgi:hypothetical protein
MFYDMLLPILQQHFAKNYVKNYIIEDFRNETKVCLTVLNIFSGVR